MGIACDLGLTPEAVARFGYMLLNHGNYRGKRIVSEKYLFMALTEQSDNRVLETSRHKNGYGFHMCIDHDGSFYHEGSFGQLCYISPNKNAVLVVTSRKHNWDDVIDLFNSLFTSAPKSNEHIRFDNLQNRLKKISYPLPVLTAIPSDAPVIGGRTYTFDLNELNLCKVHFQQVNHNRLNVILEYLDRQASNLKFDFTGQSQGFDYFIKDVQIHLQKYVSYASWQDSNILLLTVYYTETPYVVTYTICFDKDRININYHINVSFGIRACTVEGKLDIRH